MRGYAQRPGLGQFRPRLGPVACASGCLVPVAPTVGTGRPEARRSRSSSQDLWDEVGHRNVKRERDYCCGSDVRVRSNGRRLPRLRFVNTTLVGPGESAVDHSIPRRLRWAMTVMRGELAVPVEQAGKGSSSCRLRSPEGCPATHHPAAPGHPGTHRPRRGTRHRGPERQRHALRRWGPQERA